MKGFDVAVIGSGPSGIQAAIHSSRKKASTVLLGKPSGSAMSGTHVENYFGIPGKADGDGLLRTGIAQAVSFGAVHIPESVTSLSVTPEGFRAVLEGGGEVTARAVILATGVSRVKLGIPGEKEFFGKGVSYCAVCDCSFYKGLKVAVIGGEAEAASSAEMMTRYASEVFWVSDDIRAADYAVGKAEAAGVRIIRLKPVSIGGGERVDSLNLSDGSSLRVDGVFIELGARSAAELAMDVDLMPEVDDTIAVDGSCATTVPGVFACGDITGRPWQVARAVGQGAQTGLSAADYAKGTAQ